jgi:hypothetical protein
MNTHLEITRGDDETIAIAVTDQDTGAVVDLTGSTLRWMVKSLPGDADAAALLSKTNGAGITLTNASQGLATIAVAATDTAALAAGMYWWELQGRLAGLISTLASGRIKLRADLVRATT